MTAPHAFRFGVVCSQARSGAEWAAKARRAEALGYAILLIPDTLGPTLAPLPALAMAAAATQTLRVGTYVIANDFRNPLLLARDCATLDLLSGGRFELGLGAGRPGAEADNRALGIGFDSGGVRIERLAESITILKALFSGQTAPAPGPHYALEGAQLFPPPVQQPGPPILIAGAGKRMLALAAREANSVALAGQQQESLAGLQQKVSWLREAAGDRFDQLELNINMLIVGDAVPPWMTKYIGVEPAQLIRDKSPFVLTGSTDDMCAQLQERRELLGTSYISVPDFFMEACAPVVAQLAGT